MLLSFLTFFYICMTNFVRSSDILSHTDRQEVGCARQPGDFSSKLPQFCAVSSLSFSLLTAVVFLSWEIRATNVTLNIDHCSWYSFSLLVLSLSLLYTILSPFCQVISLSATQKAFWLQMCESNKSGAWSPTKFFPEKNAVFNILEFSEFSTFSLLCLNIFREGSKASL